MLHNVKISVVVGAYVCQRANRIIFVVEPLDIRCWNAARDTVKTSADVIGEVEARWRLEIKCRSDIVI